MKVKNITIEIKRVEEVLNETKDVMKRLERGETVKKNRAYILKTLWS